MKQLTEKSSAQRRKALYALADVARRLNKKQSAPGESREAKKKMARMRVWDWTGLIGLFG